MMLSPIKKRAVKIHGRQTSIALEDAFLSGLTAIAAERGMSRNALVEMIDTERGHGNLSATVRIFVLNYYRNRK